MKSKIFSPSIPIAPLSILFSIFCVVLPTKIFAQVYQTWRNEANSDSWQGNINWWKGSAGGIEFGQQEWNNNHYLTQWNNNGGNTLSTWRWLFQSGASQVHTFEGNAVRFFDYGGQDPAIINQSSATHVINMNISGDGDAGDPLDIKIDNNGGGGLTFGGTVNNQGGTINVIGSATSAATVRFNGVISGGGGMYVNNGNITVLFDAANTMSGQLTVNAGTVRLNSSGDSFGGSSQAIRIGTGTTLDLNGVSTTVGSVGEEGTNDGGTISLGGGTLTISGSSSTSQNSISGSGGITHSGSGTLALYNSQTYTGTTSVSAGTVSTSGAMSSTAYSITGTGTFRTTTTAERISDTASITLGGGTLSLGANETFGNNGVTLNTSTSSSVSVDSGVTASVSGALSGGGTLVKSGAGQFNLSGNSTSFTGAVTVSTGSLEVQSANALGSTAAGTTVNSGAELRLWHLTGVTVAAEGLNLNGAGIGSAGALRNINANNTWQGAITLGSASRINSDSGTLTLDVSSGDAITGAHNLTFGGAGNVSVSDAIATGTGTVTKDGAGTLTLSGNNTHSGETLLNNGTILVGNNGAFGTGTMTINHADGTGTRTLASSSGSGFTLNNNFNLYFNSFTLGQTSGGTGSLTLGGAGKTFFLGNDTTTQNRVITVNGNHEIAAAVTGGASNYIVKQGSGELALSGQNTSTGNIYIDSGTIHLKGGSLGAGSIDIGGGAVNNAINSDNATLKVTSGSFSRSVIINGETASGGASGTRNINFANSTGTATLSGTVALEKTAEVSVASGGAGELTGAVTGAGGISKSGSGRLTLNNANNTYSGGTTLSAGQLRLGHQAAAGTGTITQSDGTSTLEIDTTGTVTNAMNIYNVSTLKTVTLTGAKTLNNATYDVAADTTTTESGALSGTGGITKNGAGTLVVSGSSANTFTGTSAVNAGTLKLEKSGGATAISGSSIAVNGGTLLLGAANQIGDSTGITMSGGTLGMGGFNDTAGKLSVSANSIFDFGNTGAGTSTFTFNDFDTATYGGVAGLTMQNVNIGSQIVFNTNYSGNSTFNTFTTKISFSDTQLMNQISFSGGTTTLTVAAIPEPKVYVAAGALALLIGYAEVRRRKKIVSSKV